MKLMSSQNLDQQLIDNKTTQHFISTLLKNKDYNKVNYKLKMYQSLLYDLQNPNFEDAKHLYIIQNNIQQINFTLSEIHLSCDQIIEDFYSIGFKIHTEIIDLLFSSLKILNQWLVKSLKGEFYALKVQQSKRLKSGSGLCQICEQNQAAAQLKRIKTQFGMDYPYNHQNAENTSIKRDKEDLVVLQKQDFIDQLNLLLNNKENLLKMAPETWRYKELVDSLNKMDELYGEIQQSREKRNLNFSSSQFIALEDRKILEQEYQQILQEVKEILNNKFREGYSHRVRSMLDKFQVVLKDERDKKVEKRIFINIKDGETQTPVTLQTVEIKILKDSVAKKESQLLGLKQAKITLEQRYSKMMENQRKMSKANNQTSSYLIKNDGQILIQKIKQNQELKMQIVKSMEQIYKLEKEISRQHYYRTNGRKMEHQLKTYKKLNQTLISEWNQSEQKKNNQTQTDPVVIFHSIELVDQEMTENFGKRKILRRVSKQFIGSGVQESSLGKKIGDIVHNNMNQIYTNVFELVIFPIQRGRQGTHQISPSEIPTSLQILNKAGKEETSKQKVIANLNKVKGNISNKIKKVTTMNKPKLKQSEVSKQQAVEVFKPQNPIQRSQVSVYQSKNSYKKSQFAGIEQKTDRRSNSKVTLPSNFVRLAEITNDKFRLNASKGQKFLGSTENTSNTNNLSSKDGIVKINRYENQRVSRNIDRQKVKEIVALLKIQKNTNPMSSRAKYANYFDKIELTQNNVRFFTDKGVYGDHAQEKNQEIKAEEAIKQNISQNILAAKLIIEAQYSYLRAAGFLDYLFSFQKRMLLNNKATIKYKFCFNHLLQEDLKLFGGPHELVLYYKNMGIWKTLLDEEYELNLNFRFRNFAQKISKYFFLLKKMNRQFFEEYSSFIFNPFQFVMSHFGSQIKNEICQSLQSLKEEKRIGGFELNEERMTLILVRLIKYHQISHGDCQHVSEFLDKVGYYRYAI